MASIIKSFFAFFIRTYQLVLSPYLGQNCRYAPTCSEYARTAIEKYGAAKGSRLAFRRLISCNPWGGSGFDPVP